MKITQLLIAFGVGVAATVTGLYLKEKFLS